MKTTRIVACAATLLVWAASSAVAMPLTSVPSSSSDVVLAKNGYGPVPYGLYGKRKPRSHVSYGTGYRGRGTKSGGPVGGLPNRN